MLKLKFLRDCGGESADMKQLVHNTVIQLEQNKSYDRKQLKGNKMLTLFCTIVGSPSHSRAYGAIWPIRPALLSGTLV